MRLEAGEGCADFTCDGCGRRMIAVGVEDPPTTCGACRAMPGWHHDPGLRAVLAPAPEEVRADPTLH